MAQVHNFKVAMTCESCSNAVQKVLSKHQDKIESFDVNLSDQEVKVKTSLSAAEALEIIKKAGKSTEYLSTS